MEATERAPFLLRFGLVLTALKAAFFLYVFCCGGMLFGLYLGFGAVDERPGVVARQLGLGTLLGIVLSAFIAYEVVVLFTCWCARRQGRFWLWALIVVSALAFVDTGPLGMAVGLVTMLGAAQALERKSPARVSPT